MNQPLGTQHLRHRLVGCSLLTQLPIHSFIKTLDSNPFDFAGYCRILFYDVAAT